MNKYTISYKGAFGTGQSIKLTIEAPSKDAATRWALDNASEGWVCVSVHSTPDVPEETSREAMILHIANLTQERDTAKDMAQTYEQELSWERANAAELTQERDDLRESLEAEERAHDKRSADIERLVDEHQRAHSDKFDAIRDRDAANERARRMEKQRDDLRALLDAEQQAHDALHTTHTRDTERQRAEQLKNERDHYINLATWYKETRDSHNDRANELQEALNAAQIKIMGLTSLSMIDDIDTLARSILDASTDESALTLARVLLWDHMDK